MKAILITLVLATTLALGACAQNGQSNEWGMGNKQTIGTGAGALVGGILGSHVGKGSGRLWATGAGALLGAFTGSSIGKSLDKADLMYNQQAMEQSFSAPVNQEIAWSNPQSGHRGSVTTLNTGTLDGRACRKYKQTIIIDGQAQTAIGTACQNSDGTWAITNG